MSQKFRHEATEVTFFWCPIFGGYPGSLEWLLNNEMTELLISSEGFLINVCAIEAGMTRRLGKLGLMSRASIRDLSVEVWVSQCRWTDSKGQSPEREHLESEFSKKPQHRQPCCLWTSLVTYTLSCMLNSLGYRWVTKARSYSQGRELHTNSWWGNGKITMQRSMWARRYCCGHRRKI